MCYVEVAASSIFTVVVTAMASEMKDKEVPISTQLCRCFQKWLVIGIVSSKITLNNFRRCNE